MKKSTHNALTALVPHTQHSRGQVGLPYLLHVIPLTLFGEVWMVWRFSLVCVELSLLLC